MADDEAPPQAEEAEKEPEVFDFKRSDYENWRHHPVTEFIIKRYMGDCVSVLRREHLARWEEGSVDGAQEEETRVRILVMNALRDLKFEEVVAFYEDFEEQAGKPAGEQDGDGTRDAT